MLRTSSEDPGLHLRSEPHLRPQRTLRTPSESLFPPPLWQSDPRRIERVAGTAPNSAPRIVPHPILIVPRLNATIVFTRAARRAGIHEAVSKIIDIAMAKTV